MKLKIIHFFVPLLLLILSESCFTIYDTIDNRDFSKKYNFGANDLHLICEIFQPNTTNLELHFQIFPTEFFFSKTKNDSFPEAKVSLFFRVTKTHSSVTIIDSMTRNFIFRGKPRPYFLSRLPIHLPENGDYVLEVFLTDQKAEKSTSQVLNIKKDDSGSENSYLFLSQYAQPIFEHFFTVIDSFRVRNTLKTSAGMEVKKILAKTRPALPPDLLKIDDTEYNLTEDSSYFYPKIDTSLLHFREEGIYVFKNKSVKGSRAIPIFNKFYPYVKKPEQLLESLVYLSTEKEMYKLKNIQNPKIAVDTFWQNIAKDFNKARELIRIYYNRVQLANYFFVELKEGWKTDRGMIYIIFGSPTQVSINKDGEVWSYGKNKKSGLFFSFYREYHPIYGEYFELNRSEQYARSWFNAISTWRKGRVFSVMDTP